MPKHKPDNRNSRHYSDIWKYFSQTADRRKTICDICNATLLYSGSTSSMRNHIRYRHKSMYSNVTQSSNDTNKASVSTKTQSSSKQDKNPGSENVHRALAVMCAVDLLPVSIVEDQGFRLFSQTANPDYILPIPSKLYQCLEQIYEEAKQVILEEIQGQSVAVMADIWTRPSENQFVTITCYYITNSWKLESPVVTTRKLDGPLTGMFVGNCLSAVCTEYNIESMIALVADSTSLMQASAHAANITRIPSFPHALESIINGSLELPEIVDAIDRSRKLWSFFNQSQTAYDALVHQQKNMGISTSSWLVDGLRKDWRSSLKLMRSLLLIRVAIYAIVLDDQYVNSVKRAELNMDDATWNTIDSIVSVLGSLSDAVDLITKDDAPTGSCVYQLLPALTSMLSVSLKESAITTHLRKIIQEGIKTHYNVDDFGVPSDCALNSMLMTATVLDPRYKSLKFLPHDKRKVVYAYIRVCMNLMTDKSSMMVAPKFEAYTEPGGSIEGPSPARKQLLDCIRGDALEISTHQATNSTKVELDEYLAEPVRTPDPLLWWNINSN